MALNSDVAGLMAETLALSVIVTKLATNLAAVSAEHAKAVTEAIEGAVKDLGDIAMLQGDAASPQHSLKAIQIAEQIRDSVLASPLFVLPSRSAV